MAWLKKTNSQWLGCTIALLATFGAAALRAGMLSGLGSGSPFLTFYPAVVVAALLGGLPAGLLASALSGALVSYLWMEPAGSFSVAVPADQVVLAVFLCSGVLISVIIETMHRALARAAEAVATASITAARQQTDSAIQGERNFLRQVIDSFPNSIFVKDQQGTLLLVNEAMAAFHGTTVEQLVGKRVSDLGTSTPELQDRFSREDREIFNSRRALHSDAQVQDAGGRRHTLETDKSPIFNEDGSCDKLLVVTTDITERKQAEQDLRENRQLLDSIISGTPDAVFVKDTGGRYLLFNRACEALTGKSCAEVLGRRDAEVFSPAQAQAMGKGDRSVIAQRSVEIFEDTFIDAQGRKRILLATKGPVYDDQGNLSGIFTIARDTSEQKLVEEEFRNLNDELDRRVAERTAQLEAAIREQEAFSYSVSHDLRSPLRHINSYAAILLEELGPGIAPEVRDNLERIGRASSKMGKLIDDLLELARTSRLPLTEEPIDLSRLATISSLMLQQTDKARQVEFTIAEGMQVLGDKTLLRLVLENLLHNAWKYTAQEEKARIEVGMELMDGQEVFFVSDNGTGFDMAYRDKLFGPFQRLHGSEFEGNGIGLATVKRAVERHGGTIWAEGEVGNGATFYFTLGRESVGYSAQLKRNHG
jgi:PAS domain S-box-containing protein